MIDLSVVAARLRRMSRADLKNLPDGLPAGRLITPAESDGPALWVSDEQLSDADMHWARLYDIRRETGLYPLLLDGLSSEPTRPWHDAELWPKATADIDAVDATDVLAKRWRELMDNDEEVLSLAPAGTTDADADAVARHMAEGLGEVNSWFLGLVPADRGADALTVAGWNGPCNYINTEEVSAVVRSWENRFGARVVAVGFDVLHLSVATPPTTIEHAGQVAAEHFAFCPDNIWQGIGDIDEYAFYLVGAERWRFWWD
ncbi:MAG: DUF4253 domain-containing protein [Actinomadura rubrobrunea]|nr:DUF4253 domain-containing protein [Actinomadura rubrobrunea]